MYNVSAQIKWKLIMSTHVSHPDILKRLKRAQGHLKSVVKMLEEDRECLEIAQQLQAVEKAISGAKKILIHDHIDHCLEHSVRQGSKEATATIREFREITKYL
jgi:DNA-binding FrmR family transcriptional regulator